MGKSSKKELEIQMRIHNYELQREELIRQGYKEYIGTISVIKANIFAFLTAGPFALAAALVYFFFWGDIEFHASINFFAFLLFFTISIPLHEFLHGLTWHLFCKKKWKSIHFGIMWEYLTPYCHCKEPLQFGSYLLGGLMPFMVLGVGISIAGIVFHSFLFLALGAMNLLCAGGDTTIALMLLKYRTCRILDHPTECGFIAFKKSEP